MANNPRKTVPEHPPEFPQLSRYLAERSPQPMVAVEGLTHIVRYMNPAFCALAGSEAAHLVGRPFVLAVPESAANLCAAMLDRVFEHGLSEALAEQEHADAAEVAAARGRAGLGASYWSYLAWPILGPIGAARERPVGVMIQVTDATGAAVFRTGAAAINEALLLSGVRQHELAEEAAHLNAMLRESEAHEREARLEAQGANRSKDFFLATLSHELRTPLSAVLGWAVMLRAGDRPLSTDIAEGLIVIERNARALGKLIEDVLDVARITAGKFTLDTRPENLTALVMAAAESARPLASAKAISLEVAGDGGEAGGGAGGGGDLWVMADAPRLQQAISNVLSNALKFTPPGGRVTVRLGRVPGKDGDDARVSICDTGRGIDPESLISIFDRFKQAGEGTTRSFGGLGLGLSIVRHIMEAHHGAARAASEGQGRGATFTLDLPAIPAAASPAPPPAAPSGKAMAGDGARTSAARRAPLDGLRILVVDDEEDARTIAGRALRSAGATVILASTAEEGYRFAVRGGDGDGGARPLVVVSDISMPGEDGYSMMRRVRAERTGEEVPAVALTALAAPADRAEALRAGYQVHLPKPIDPRELVAAVARVAGRFRG
ncbi:MAG: ATP-binding protein [Phycisphaerales bacterium]